MNHFEMMARRLGLLQRHLAELTPRLNGRDLLKVLLHNKALRLDSPITEAKTAISIWHEEESMFWHIS